MKNTIPLIMAVILGLAAVFAVNRSIARSAVNTTRTKNVLVANHQLQPGAKIEAGAVEAYAIPVAAYMEGRHILDSQKYRIEGLKVVNRVAKGSPVLWEDLDTKDEGERVGNGEFVVSVRFQNSALLESIRPGDEIAIAALQMMEIQEQSGTTDLGVAPRVRREQRLTVLFPCVTVREISRDSVLVSAPPQKALQLLVASQSIPLYPLLRRKGDSENRGVGVGGSVSAADLTVEKLSVGQQ